MSLSTDRIHSGLTRIDALVDSDRARWGGAIDLVRPDGGGYDFMPLHPLGVPVAITYSFREAAPDGYEYSYLSGPANFQPATPDIREAVRGALAQIASFTGASFVEVSDAGAGGMLQIGMHDMGGNTAGYAYFASASEDPGPAGDIWYAPSVIGAAPGNGAWQTVLHEIGHAMGLKHPGAYGSNPDPAETHLPAGEDNTQNTVMSYTQEGGSRTAYGPYDVLALRFLYGSSEPLHEGPFRVGGEADEQLVGGEGFNLLAGGGGNDTLHGLGGGDDLVGGEGHDLIYGGLDVDRMEGQAGDDTVFAGDGADIAFGGEGDDFLLMEAGNDLAYGNAGFDTLIGGTGGDRLFGGRDADLVHAEDGDDTGYGNLADDLVDLGAGNDTGYGGQGADTLLGGEGDDRLLGNLGDDTLDGGAGADWLAGGGGDDLLIGGAGGDTFEIAPGFGFDTAADIVAGTDLLYVKGYAEGDYTIGGDAGGVVLTFSDGAAIRLVGVSADMLPWVLYFA